MFVQRKRAAGVEADHLEDAVSSEQAVVRSRNRGLRRID
jgi:hypothetical protein